MADEPKYTELFIIEFTGTVSDLEENLNTLEGLEHHSITRPGFRLSSSMEVEAELNADIKYNTHQTSRDRLAMQIEEIDGVSEVTLG